MKMHQIPKSDAEYEAIRCERGRRAIDALLEARGQRMIATQGWRRWNEAMEQVEVVMIQIESEMEAYYDRRSPRWRNGRPGYSLIKRLKDIQAVQDAVTSWLTSTHDDSGVGDFVTLRENEESHGETA